MQLILGPVRVRNSACVLITWLCMAMAGADLHAQYGFTPYVPTYSYANDWTNQYAGAMVQIPSYGTTPVNSPLLYANSQNWRLGAVAVNTPNGVLITQVQPGSIASYAGLKNGDVVVSVGGAQVGYVNGRSTDLIYEINRRVDSSGRVPLVILDSSTRQLRNTTLSIFQPTITGSMISGQITVENSYLLNNYRMLKVELQNASRPYMQIAGGSDYRAIYGNGPFSYTLRYDPQFISPGDRYRLVATIFDSRNQVVAFGSQDIAAPVMGISSVVNFRLQGPQIYNSSSLRPVSYYYGSTGALNESFRQYLGRDPSLSEAQAWSQQLASGMLSVSDMKAELLGSPAFYDRAGNSPDLFIQQMIETTTRQPAPFDQIVYWRARLEYYGGNRISVAKEYMAGRPF